jgi:hypothetical protein
MQLVIADKFHVPINVAGTEIVLIPPRKKKRFLQRVNYSGYLLLSILRTHVDIKTFS